MSPLLLQTIVFMVTALLAGLFGWLMLRLSPQQPVRSTNKLSLRSPELNSASSKYDASFYRFVSDLGLGLHPTIVVLACCGFSILFGLTILVFFDSPLSAIISAGACLAVLLLGALLWQRRQHGLVLDQLPNAIEMLARGVQAGESFEQAFRAVAKNTSDPLAAELRRTVQKLDLGQSVPDSLRQLEQRYPFFDMRMFISAITINRQAGGDLPATLTRLSVVSRERMSYRRRLKSMLASARLAALLIALATPGLLLYYALNKDYLRDFISNPSGQFYLLLAIGLEFCGVVWLFALSRSEI